MKVRSTVQYRLLPPSTKEPAAKLLVHGQPCRAVAIDRTGNYMATSSTDR